MNSLEQGPYLQQLSDSLDFYKATMSQIAYEQYPKSSVTFELKNRSKESLLEYVDPNVLQERLNIIAKRGFSEDELNYLSNILVGDNHLFYESYIAYLKNNSLPMAYVSVNQELSDLKVQSNGDWPLVTFWETVVMAEINELYFDTYVRKNNLDTIALYDSGDARLTDKIEVIKNNPKIKFVDFGTRRHFSYRWQKYVVERLANELPGQFIGTSNIGLANHLGIMPVGTFAHEMPMIYAALADKNHTSIKESHGTMLDDWYKRYNGALSIALTDTFGSSFFFADFGAERAATWRGLRHDSGDPIEFGEKTLNFYKQNAIDPKTKTIVFSDGLKIDDIVRLQAYFDGQINTVFGWGTSLTNDLGLPALNIVMKATAVDGYKTVKLSDTVGKHTGDQISIERYKNEFFA